MLMALLLMLAAVMVSAVVIASSVSAVSSLRADREEEQSYLTVSSAAELVRDELASEKSSSKTIVTKTYSDSSYSERYLKETSTNATAGTGVFAEIVSAGMAHLQEYPTDTYQKTCTIRTDGYEDVSAEFFLELSSDANGNEFYELTVWFTGGEEPNACRMCLTMEGTQTTTTTQSQSSSSSSWWWSSKEYYLTTTTTVNWTNGRIQKREAAK